MTEPLPPPDSPPALRGRSRSRSHFSVRPGVFPVDQRPFRWQVGAIEIDALSEASEQSIEEHKEWSPPQPVRVKREPPSRSPSPSRSRSRSRASTSHSADDALEVKYDDPEVDLGPSLARARGERRKARWLSKIPPEQLHFGGDWWLLTRFVREVESACALMAGQFDFDAYRVEMLFTPNPRPDEVGSIDDMRLFLEWFGQCGYCVVWCWQMINLSRQQNNRRPFTLWDLIDNRSLLTKYVSFIQIVHAEIAVSRGDKDPGRANVRAIEKQRRETLLHFASIAYTPPRDGQANVLDNSKSLPRRVPQVPSRELVTDSDHLAANKHLLLKWCAQACGVNTTAEVYKPPTRKPLNAGSSNGSFPIKDELGLAVPDLPVINPSAAPGVLPSSFHHQLHAGLSMPPAPSLQPQLMNPFNASIDKMEVSVKQVYQLGIDALVTKSGYASSEHVEQRLLLNGTLRDHAFFAMYCSLLANARRGYTNRSRLPGVVRDRMSKQWDDLEVYFTRWTRSF